MSSKSVTVGRIVGVYGVKGWVKVFSFTDPRENIQHYQPWLLGKSSPTTVKVTAFRPQGKSLVAKLEGIDDRQAAEALVGQDVAVAEDALPVSANGEYLWRDLIGLRVALVDGQDLGSVRAMMETGANDVLVVRGDSNSRDRQERLIPWLPDNVIVDVDLANGKLIVDWDPEF